MTIFHQNPVVKPKRLKTPISSSIEKKCPNAPKMTPLGFSGARNTMAQEILTLVLKKPEF